MSSNQNRSKDSATAGSVTSHVPCKFYKKDQCRAGSSCPFSHSNQVKNKTTSQPCTWYLKGSCRFGHRCALSHVMPGQPQSMDKKNKKEALQVQKDIVKDSLNKADDMLNLPQSTSLGNVNQQSKPAMNPEQHQLSQSLSSFQRPSMYYNWRSFSYTDIDDDDDDHHETLDDLENGEEFLPSSLDELLTPLERRRKHSSRTSSISSAFTLSPTTTTTTRKLPSIQPLNKTDMESSTITVKPHEEDSTQFDLDLDLEF